MLLALLLIALCHRSAVGAAAESSIDIDDQTLWSRFRDAFGSTSVLSSFASRASLFSAVSSELDTASQIGCSLTYDYGASIAMDYRDRGDFSVVPFFVSKENDTMCFMLAPRSDPIPSLQFQVPYPSALKVDSSISDVVSQLSSETSSYVVESRLQSAVFSLRHNAPTDPTNGLNLFVSVHNSSAKWSNANSQNFALSSISTILQRLVEYRTGSMEDFYFIAPKDQSVLSVAEKDRVVLWNKGRAALLEKLKERANPTILTPGLLTPDPCNFRKSIAKFILSKGDPTTGFPLDDTLAVENSTVAAGCVAFVAASISQLPSVTQLSISTSFQLFNYRARSIIQSGEVSQNAETMPYSKSRITGNGQIIGVADTGLDMKSCYFADSSGNVKPSIIDSPITDHSKRKVVQYCYTSRSDQSDTLRGHGTHVAGTVAGKIPNADLYTDGKYNGVAPDAKIAFMDLSRNGGGLTTPRSEALYSPGRAAGARIHTNSWGGYYGKNPSYKGSDVDAYLFKNQDTAIFFSAGNGGDFLPDPSISVQSSSKNAIIVASGETTLHSKDIDFVAYYSSKGPAHDGRIKPDITAPGDALLSASSNGDGGNTCETTEKSGTSMASPAAAGAAAIIRQYFMSNKYWSTVCSKTYRNCKVLTPSGPMIKALVLHSGRKMKKFNGDKGKSVDLGDAPDVYQGYGRMQLAGMLPFPSSAFDLYISDDRGLEENKQRHHYVHVTDSTISLKVTVVWYDPPNIDGITGRALLHDLDLVALSPRKKIFRGNGRADHLNSNEKIQVDNPQKGIWQVTVSCGALPVTGDQDYALVITSGGFVGGPTSSSTMAESSL